MFFSYLFRLWLCGGPFLPFSFLLFFVSLPFLLIQLYYVFCLLISWFSSNLFTDDESNHIMFPSDDSPDAVPAKTTWTFLLYLTSPATGCQGGETVFYPEAVSKREAAPAPVVVNLEVGMALLHRHGKECILHEGKEVTEGEKWVIRSDVCVKR